MSNDNRSDEVIVQVSGFGVNNTVYTRTEYMLVALTSSGRVIMSTGDGIWADVTGNAKQQGKTA